MDEIAEVWKVRQKRLRTARIEWEETRLIPKHSQPPAESLLWEGKVTKKEFAKLDPLPPADITLKMKHTALLDGGMLTLTHEGDRWDLSAGKVKKAASLSTFDGKDSKLLLTGDPEMPMGVIWNEDRNANPLAQALVLHFQPCGSRVDGDDLKNYRLVAGNERETIDGRECIVVERMPPGPPYEDDIRTSWLDPKRNFVPVRTRYGWKGRNVYISYRKDPMYGWIPSGWCWTYPEGKKFFERITAKVTRCEINVDIPKSEFQLEFPVGTYVMEHRGDDHFRWIVWPNGEKRAVPKNRRWKKDEQTWYLRSEIAKAREAEAQIKKGNQP